MAINTFNVPFPDFKLLEVIDPEQFDANNAETVAKINEIAGVVNDEKMDATGDFKGTWFGLLPGEVAEAINGGRLDVIEPIVTGMESRLATAENTANETNTTIIQLKGALQNAQQEIANLNLYTDANNRVKTGYTYGTNFDAIFGMEIDYTKTNTISNLAVGQTMIGVVSADGFVVGQEITIYDDVNLERVKITAISGTNITIAPALTKEFKNQAGVARSMFTKDANNKNLSFGGWSESGQKRALYIDGGKSYTSATPYNTGALNITPPTAHTILGHKQFSVEMDVMIPHFSEYVTPTQHAHKLKTLFAVGTNVNGTDNDVVFGYTTTPYVHSSEQYNGKNDFLNQYVENATHTFGFVYRAGSNTTYTNVVLTTEKDFLMNFYGKHINIKIVMDFSSASSISSGFKLFINNIQVPLISRHSTIPASPVLVNPTNQIKMNYVKNTAGEYPSFTELGFAYVSRYIVHRDTTFTRKLLDYTFDADIVNGQVLDTSGNSVNMNIPNIQNSNPVRYAFGVQLIDKKLTGIPTSDLRFKSTLDSKELGVWITKDSTLTAVEGKYGDVSMDLKTVGNENQFIGTRDTVGTSDVRLTYNRDATSFFPTIKKIVGGVY